MIRLNYRRLSYLGERVKGGIATKAEQDEFMLMVYQSDNIEDKQYYDYRLDIGNTAEIVNAALAVAAIMLVNHVLGKLL